MSGPGWPARVGQVIEYPRKHLLVSDSTGQKAFDVLHDEGDRLVPRQNFEVVFVEKIPMVSSRVVVRDAPVSGAADKAVSLTGRAADQHPVLTPFQVPLQGFSKLDVSRFRSQFDRRSLPAGVISELFGAVVVGQIALAAQVFEVADRDPVACFAKPVEGPNPQCSNRSWIFFRRADNVKRAVFDRLIRTEPGEALAEAAGTGKEVHHLDLSHIICLLCRAEC